jgi:hypothetical protein
LTGELVRQEFGHESGVLNKRKPAGTSDVTVTFELNILPSLLYSTGASKLEAEHTFEPKQGDFNARCEV